MTALPLITSGGTLTAEDGYALPNRAITPIGPGFTSLWLPELVGENREVIDGHVAFRSVIKQQSADIPLLVIGDVDADGVPIPGGGLGGVWRNVQDLRDSFEEPSLTGDGTQTLTFVPFPGGPELTGPAKCTGITLTNPHPGAWRVALHLVLPAGPLVETEASA